MGKRLFSFLIDLQTQYSETGARVGLGPSSPCLRVPSCAQEALCSKADLNNTSGENSKLVKCLAIPSYYVTEQRQRTKEVASKHLANLALATREQPTSTSSIRSTPSHAGWTIATLHRMWRALRARRRLSGLAGGFLSASACILESSSVQQNHFVLFAHAALSGLETVVDHLPASWQPSGVCASSVPTRNRTFWRGRRGTPSCSNTGCATGTSVSQVGLRLC